MDSGILLDLRPSNIERFNCVELHVCSTHKCEICDRSIGVHSDINKCNFYDKCSVSLVDKSIRAIQKVRHNFRIIHTGRLCQYNQLSRTSITEMSIGSDVFPFIRMAE